MVKREANSKVGGTRRRDNHQPSPRLQGVFAAALTPMDENLNPGHEAFAAHCRRLLEAGCHGLGIFGTTGEANSLSVEERIVALEALLQVGIPAETLFPGTGACALTDAARLTRAVLEMGITDVLVVPPFYYKNVENEGVFRYFAEVIERIGDDRLRVYLYNFPQMTGVEIGLPLIGRLIEAYPEVVVGTKDSSGDRDRLRETCRAFPDFAVFPGTERYLLDALRWGGAGCISATANVTSRLVREVYDAHHARRDDEADALQKQLTTIRATMEKHPLIPALKALTQKLTGEEVWSNLRPPLTSIEDGTADELAFRLPMSELL